MAVDLGDRRIGLAISDPTGTIASPAGFVERRAGKRPPLTAILAQAAALGATGFVVGLPLDANGAETPRTVEARRLAHELSTRTGLEARLVDERFTTAAALQAIREMEGSTRGRKGDVDSMAATLLLQHALRLAEHEEDDDGEDARRPGPRACGSPPRPPARRRRVPACSSPSGRDRRSARPRNRSPRTASCGRLASSRSTRRFGDATARCDGAPTSCEPACRGSRCSTPCGWAAASFTW